MENNKYSRGKIYTIRCRTDDSLVYVGSTINELRKRWNSHKSKSKKDEQRNLYDIIEHNGGFDNWYIELFENYKCNDMNELHRREGEIIREQGTLNKIISGRTFNEWRMDKKDHIQQVQKKWRQQNPEKIDIYTKNYKQTDKYRVKNKDNCKKAYLKRRDNESPEQRAVRIQKQKEDRDLTKTMETIEEKETRLEKNRIKTRKYRDKLKKEQQKD